MFLLIGRGTTGQRAAFEKEPCGIKDQNWWTVVALSLYLQQTTQRRHTPGLPVTYGNTQTQVTERQTEDTGIIHKRTTDKHRLT